MEANFHHCLQLVLAHEGGFVHDPQDPGGITNLGVTKSAWEAYAGHAVNETFMRGLTPVAVAPFYKLEYWDKVRGDQLPSGVDCAVFDYAVNSGTGRAARTLQQAAGVLVDGSIGPATLAAVAQKDPVELVTNICKLRQSFLQALPTFGHFGKGWTARVAQVKNEACGLTKVVA